MRTALVTVLAALTLMACGRGDLSRQQRAVEQQILTDRVNTWARHMNNQAVDSLAPLYLATDDLYSVWPDSRRSQGWDEERAALRTLFDQVETLNLVVQDPAVRLLNWGTAVVTFRYSMDQLLRGSMRDISSGHITQVWTRVADAPAWRIVVSQMSRAPAGPTAQPVSD